jgi:hypothetical protein
MYHQHKTKHVDLVAINNLLVFYVALYITHTCEFKKITPENFGIYILENYDALLE